MKATAFMYKGSLYPSQAHYLPGFSGVFWGLFLGGFFVEFFFFGGGGGWRFVLFFKFMRFGSKPHKISILQVFGI